MIYRAGGTPTGGTAQPRPPADDEILDRTGSSTTDGGLAHLPGDGSLDLGNAERPRDRAPEIPTEIIPPTGVAQPGTPSEGAQPSTPAYEQPYQPPPPDTFEPPPPVAQPPASTAAPSRPDEPTPVAGEPPDTFTPMPPPPSVVRKQIVGAPQLPSSNLLGKAGGLLGGGLGVPATARGETGSVSALIEQLLRRGF